MVDVFVILPDQLFYTNEALAVVLNDNVSHVYMFEDPLYFTRWKYHASKLALHRASMQRYYKMLKKITNVHYIPLNDIKTDWIDYLEQKVSPTSVEMFYPSSLDEWGSKLYKTTFTGLPIKFHDTPAFLLGYDYIQSEFGPRSKIAFNTFYKQVRKDFFIQLNPRDSKGKYRPLGGQWIYGEESHKPIAAGTEIPLLPKLPINEEFRQACDYIKSMPSRGTTQRYPIDGKEALKWFSHFIDNKLVDYAGRQLITIIGAENDIMNDVGKTLFHSAISISLNIGIITPKQVLTDLFMAFKHRGTEIPIASFEGFFRQMIWREYTRMIYVNAPVQLLELPNYFNAESNAGDEWYNGTTQMEPIDMIIKDVLQNGYAHNTQRMYWLGAYMMMQQLRPIDIRNWFMSMFADAYPWSVIPHVLLMHGSPEYGGTLPIRMSNFLINTSNLGKNKTVMWFNKWDLLYYLFIGRNASKLTKINPKLSKQWKDKPVAERRKLLDSAKSLLIDKSTLQRSNDQVHSKQAQPKQAHSKQAQSKQAHSKQAPRHAIVRKQQPKQAQSKQAQSKQAQPKQAQPKQAHSKQAQPKQAQPKQTTNT